MLVRPYKPSDATALAQIFYESVHGLGPSDYSSAQIAAWAPTIPNASNIHDRASRSLVTLVTVSNDDVPNGYVVMEADGHIDHLYRLPGAPGAAAALYKALEEVARAHNLTILYTEASEAARRFFSIRGFSTIERRDFELRGTSIHNYAMQKRLR